ncbi:MAG: hypothetical protein LBQ62_00615, partial [Candidatus Accumulibacter sp.]|nr:hypothetical protein [Accumulibacter sp.]
RHSRAGGNPEKAAECWIPACAGMTGTGAARTGCIGFPFPLSEMLSSVCNGGLSSLSSFHEFFMNLRGNFRDRGQSVTGATRRK